MKKLIKSFNNETVYVLGLDVKDVAEDIFITDDYSMLIINFNDNDYKIIETVGLVFLLTEEEFNKYNKQNLIEWDEESDDKWCLKVLNYTGAVYLDVIDGDIKESVLIEIVVDSYGYTRYVTTVNLNDIYYELFIEFDTDSSNSEYH